MGAIAWIALKVVLSVVLAVLAAMALAVASTGAWAGLAFAAGIVAVAALLWVGFDPSDAGPTLLLGIFASGCAIMSVCVLTGVYTLPADCGGGRGAALCSVINLLHDIGGRPAAALPPLSSTALFAWLTRAANRGRRTAIRPLRR